MTATTATDLTVRDLRDADLHDLMKIERSSFDEPWDRNELYRVLSRKHCCAMVAVSGRRHVVGFLVVDVLRESCIIVNLAVHPKSRRQGVGRALLAALQDRMLTTPRRRKLRAEVRETNLPTQLFLKALGFKAVEVVRRYYEETNEDMYRFEKLLPAL